MAAAPDTRAGGHPAPLRSADDLIRARRAGRLSRRALLERARDLGFGAAVTSVILHATGDAAWGAPRAQTPQVVTATGPTAPEGQRRVATKVTGGVVGSIDTLNPYLTNLYGPTYEALAGVMEGLMGYDGSGRLQPQLAESVAIADDGLSYTFTLRQNVVFHNGDAFGPKDVVASWQAIIDSALPAWSRLGWNKVADIEVPDERTVVVKTSEVYGPFLSHISSGLLNNAAIAPESVLKLGASRVIADLGRQPIGTGPFAFVSYGGSEILLKRNTRHWGTTGNVERIAVRLFPDPEQQFTAFAAGEIDLIPRLGKPGASRVADALPLIGRGVLAYPSLVWGHLDLKHIDALTELPVRQALAHAIPVQRLIDEALGGEAVRAAADQPPTSPWFANGLEPRDYDPKRARELLDDAGFVLSEEGVRVREGLRLEIELWAADDDLTAPGALAIIAEAWGAIGVATRIRYDDPGHLWGPMGYQFSDFMTAGYYRWTNANDPDDYYYWHSSQIPDFPGDGGGNVPAYFNAYAEQATIDRLTERGLRTADPAERREIYAELQRLLAEQTPVIFLFWDTAFAAHASDIGGYWPNAYTYLTWNAGAWYRVRLPE